MHIVFANNVFLSFQALQTFFFFNISHPPPPPLQKNKVPYDLRLAWNDELSRSYYFAYEITKSYRKLHETCRLPVQMDQNIKCKLAE